MFIATLSELSIVMGKMHKEEDKPGRDPSTSSQYLPEYIAKIKWSFRELISKLQLDV